VSNRRKIRQDINKPRSPQHRNVPASRSGRSLLVVGDGYYSLPAAVEDVEAWRRSLRARHGSGEPAAVIDALAEMMITGITTGRGVVSDDEIENMIVVHWPAGTDSVLHIDDLCRDVGLSRAAVRRAMDQLDEANVLLPCSGFGCHDGGWRSTVPHDRLFEMLAASGE
jgi:hypothetical protein